MSVISLNEKSRHLYIILYKSQKCLNEEAYEVFLVLIQYIMPISEVLVLDDAADKL